MKPYPVLIYPDPILSTPASAATGDATPLLDRLRAVLEEVGGLGLAAPQIGVGQRVCILKDATGDILEMVNPSFLLQEDIQEFKGEGCLSFPGQRFNTKRYNRVIVRYTDRFGSERSLDAAGLLAVECQHEIDHLDGKLILDGQAPVIRSLVRERMLKLKRKLEKNNR